MKASLICAAALGITLMTTGCESQPTQPGDSPEKNDEADAQRDEVPSLELRGNAALGNYGLLPVPEDYRESAEEQINESNYLDRLDELERDFATE